MVEDSNAVDRSAEIDFDLDERLAFADRDDLKRSFLVADYDLNDKRMILQDCNQSLIRAADKANKQDSRSITIELT